MTPTPEQINAMSAGRETDAAVAESLGYKVERWNEYAVILDAGVPGYPTVMDDDGKTILHEFPHHSMWVWLFSTDISAAFEMEAEIERRELAREYSDELQVLIENRTGRCRRFDYCHASPLDRCKAALLVLVGQEG